MAGKLDASTLELINIRTITLDDLISDAVARKDEAAMDWLEEQANKEVERTNPRTNEKYKVRQPITSYRQEYLKTYCGYNPKSKNNAIAKEIAKQKQQEKINNKFAAARAEMKK